MEEERESVSKQNEQSDNYSNIVSGVIHEYDGDQIINDSESNAQRPIVKDGGCNGGQAPVEEISSRHRLSSSERSHTLAEDKIEVISCPKVNCPEKIIFCIDASVEMEKMTFRSRAGDKLSPKQLVKKGLAMFLQSKARIDRKHEFALILMQETAIWVRDFTRNPRDIQLALDDNLDPPFCETCDMGSVFDKIADKVELPHIEGNPEIIPPPYTVRLVFIYGRSHCVLEFPKKESYNILNLSPHFFLDALYLHEPPSQENKCQEVFDTVCDLDIKGLSYILGASRNPTKVYDSMAQLLAHPLQRPVQNDAAYRIGSSIPTIPVPENG
ncbi:BRISC and BRCA1-A complex member 1-like isoform X2 [Mercenaria mercenaria]|uniref:BRISC and BRCA1-A complex member 1-like isoform X2 n=1 Tax=Mercenaria mercenaria TaxID=6596 RepID=UPI00234EDE5E|nr:BRISC and BRCA1-A complex member 1-like isoform X2 [Mercenaria mercenaria]